jgi:cytochrome c biogenesis protein ResB
MGSFSHSGNKRGGKMSNVTDTTHSGIVGFLFGAVFGALIMFTVVMYQPPSVNESEVIDRGFAHYNVITNEFIWHKQYTVIEDEEWHTIVKEAENLSLWNLQDE